MVWPSSILHVILHDLKCLKWSDTFFYNCLGVTWSWCHSNFFHQNTREWYHWKDDTKNLVTALYLTNHYCSLYCALSHKSLLFLEFLLSTMFFSCVLKRIWSLNNIFQLRFFSMTSRSHDPLVIRKRVPRYLIYFRPSRIKVLGAQIIYPT